ncbi:MAG TPA: hypothetical protein VMU50_08600, partial [Polyangia bacterium]|nr:hypothetical protein [Polyangia bacterium]
LATMVHAGTGIARVALPADDLDALATALQAPRALARRAGGYVVVESAPLGSPGRGRLPWRAGEAPRVLDERVRVAWDPARRLNPGRMAS